MTYLDTPVDATVSQYRPVDLSDEYTSYSRDQIKQMVYDLGALAKENETFRLDIVSLRNTISALQRQNSYANNLFANAKVIILESFKDDEFGKDNFTAVAEALDITLINKYDVTVTVTYRGTIEIPMDEDIEDFERHISFEFSAPFSDEWNVDIYQDDIEINYDEVSWKD
jgi:hypothetical protein